MDGLRANRVSSLRVEAPQSITGKCYGRRNLKKKPRAVIEDSGTAAMLLVHHRSSSTHMMPPTFDPSRSPSSHCFLHVQLGGAVKRRRARERVGGLDSPCP